jgi:hypothetical protein
MSPETIKSAMAGGMLVGVTAYCIHRLWCGRKVAQASASKKTIIDLSRLDYNDNPANWYLHDSKKASDEITISRKAWDSIIQENSRVKDALFKNKIHDW